MAAPVANWTGFYIFGGGGGGLSNSDQSVQTTVGALPLTIAQRQGGSGWFGTVGLGYDWQFSGTWVAGVFADGQFGSIRATVQDPINRLHRQPEAGRLRGPLVFASAGWSRRTSSPTSTAVIPALTSARPTSPTLAGVPTGTHLGSYNRNGWFIGGGVENNLNIFGIQSPGWFMKTEYRSAFYGAKTQTELSDAATFRSATASAPTAGTRRSRPRWSTASTGPVRSSRSTDLISLIFRRQSPGIAGAFSLYGAAADLAYLDIHLSCGLHQQPLYPNHGYG